VLITPCHHKSSSAKTLWCWHTRIMLSASDVGFRLFHNHRIHLQMPSELSQNRWQMIRQ
jgi:hypothetical protein